MSAKVNYRELEHTRHLAIEVTARSGEEATGTDADCIGAADV
jgi:hypothetical protein